MKDSLLAAAAELLRHGRYEEGWRKCEALLISASDCWRSQAVAARTLLEWGKLDDGNRPSLLHDSVKHFDIALELLRDHTRESAARCRERCDVSDPCAAPASAPADSGNEDDLVELLNDRGVALYELEELDEAKAAFELVLGMRPRHGRALTNLGLIHWAEGHERVALSTLDSAVDAAEGHNPHALNNRGALRLELGETERALPDFHSALALDPGYETARRNRDTALSALSEPVPMRPVDEG